jgi:ribosomal protein S13
MGPGQGVVMRDEVGLSGRCGFTLLGITVLGLPVGLFLHGISIPVFTCVATVWLLVSVMLILGESVTEVTIWKTSIKRDVKAAQLARDEAEAIRDQLKTVAKLNIENAYLLNSMVAGLYSRGHPSGLTPPACEHIAENLMEMTPIISTDETIISEWQQRMRNLMQK